MPCNSCNSTQYDRDEMVKVDSTDMSGWLSSKLCAGNNITLNITGGNGNKCIEISSPDILPQTIVTSNDSSVTVNYDGDHTYDLSVSCCDIEDKFVAVANGCTPGYLQNQIVQQPGGAILVGVNGSCQVEIGLDESKLTIQDEKVSISGSCTPGYLPDVLTVSDGIKRQINTGSCSMNLSIDSSWIGFKRPWAVLGLINRIDKSGIAQGEESSTIVAFDEGNTNYPGMITGTTTKVIVIPKDGLYHVNIFGLVELNDSIHAIRALLYANSTETGAIDIKHGAGYTGGDIGTGLKGSLGGVYGENVRTMSGSAILSLTTGDALTVIVKHSCTVDGNYRQTTTGRYLLLGQDGGILTPDTGPNRGWRLEVAYIGDLIVS